MSAIAVAAGNCNLTCMFSSFGHAEETVDALAPATLPEGLWLLMKSSRWSCPPTYTYSTFLPVMHSLKKAAGRPIGLPNSPGGPTLYGRLHRFSPPFLLAYQD